MGRKKKQKRKLKTLQQALDYINDKSRIIKEITIAARVSVGNRRFIAVGVIT